MRRRSRSEILDSGISPYAPPPDPLEFQRVFLLQRWSDVIGQTSHYGICLNSENASYNPNIIKAQEQNTDNKARGMLFMSSIAECFFTRLNIRKDPTRRNAGTILTVMLVFPRNDVTAQIRKYVYIRLLHVSSVRYSLLNAAAREESIIAAKIKQNTIAYSYKV